MKPYIFPLFLVTVFVFFLLTGGGQSLAAVSSRPEVQKNFQRLLETRSCPSCDFAGADLTRANLKEVDLSGANLAGAKLTLADLSRANLKNANLQGANLGGADLAYADLEGANLTGAVLEGAFLGSAKMKGTVVTKSTHEVEIKSGIGEKVFVPDESQSKRQPYTQDSPLEAAPQKIQTEAPVAPAPASIPAAQKKAQPAQVPASVPAPSVDQVQSKKLAPMSEAVVPEGAEAAQKPAPTAEKKSPDSPLAKDDRSSLNTNDALPVIEEEKPTVVQAADTPGVQDSASSTLTPERAAEQTTAAEEKESKLEAAAPVQAELAQNVHAPAQTAAVTSSGTDTATANTSVVDEQVAAGQQDAPVQQPAVEDSAVQPETPVAAKGEVVAKARQEITNPAPGGTVPAVKQVDAGKQNLLTQLFDKKRCVGCDLSGVDLSGRSMGGFDLERANLAGSNLRGVGLGAANLKGSNFSDTQMQEADLRKADLYRADFSGADLTGARFHEALVDSTNFSGAIGVNLEGAIVSK